MIVMMSISSEINFRWTVFEVVLSTLVDILPMSIGGLALIFADQRNMQ